MDEIKSTLAWVIYEIEHWRPASSEGVPLGNLAQGYNALARARHNLQQAETDLYAARDLLVPKLKQEMEAGEHHELPLTRDPRQRPTGNVYTHLKQQLDALAKEG